MHGDSRITQHRFRPRRCYCDMRWFTWFRIENRVLQVPEMPLGRCCVNFVVADSGLQESVPVHQPLASEN